MSRPHALVLATQARASTQSLEELTDTVIFWAHRAILTGRSLWGRLESRPSYAACAVAPQSTTHLEAASTSEERLAA